MAYCFSFLLLALFCTIAVCSVGGVPKKYDSSVDGGFQPSSGSFYKPTVTTTPTAAVVEKTGEPRAIGGTTKYQKLNTSASEIIERDQRFGVTGYGAYGAGGTPVGGVYTPLKIDIGGIVLGTLIGLGAVLIVPKLAHAFSYPYDHHGYGRSAEDGITEILSSIDSALERYNIDTSSCMQRFVCTTVKNARVNMVEGSPTSVDQWVETVTTNPLFTNMIDGTAIKQAVDAGWKNEQNSCEIFHPKCSVNKQAVMQLVSNFLPS